MLSSRESEYLDAGESGIARLLQSNDPRSGQTRRHAVRLIIEAMGNETTREVTTIDDLICLPLSLWLLRNVDEHLLTSRVLNHSRDLVDDFIRSAKVIPDYVPDYARRYGVEMEYQEEDGTYAIPASEFVTYTSRLSGFKYRLVYQNVASGIVYADRETAAKVIREAFVRNAFLVYNGINKGDTSRVLQPIKESIDLIANTLESSGIKKNFDLGEVDFDLFPPCIKEFISQMQDGVNLPHMARFTLVSFLHNVGMDNEGIMGLFKTAPDFRESLTKYQVNHVTGEISGTEYSPPKCTVLQSNHLCYKGDDTLCAQDWLNHPLKYYTVKKKPRKPRKGGFAKRRE